MSRSLFNPLAMAVLALAVFAPPTLARADHGEGSIRLGAGSTLISVDHAPETETNTLIFGLAPPLTGTALHFGYLLTDSIYLGLQFAFGGVRIDSRFSTATGMAFTMLPRFVYQIAISSALNIYFGAEAGFTIAGDWDNNPSDFFRASGIGGLSFFATESFSLDGDFTLGAIHEFDSGSAAVHVGLNIIFSGWIDFGDGGSSSSPSSDDEPSRSRQPERTSNPDPEPAPADDPEPETFDDPEGGLP